MNQTLVDRREVTATEERMIGTNTWQIAPGVWRMKDIFVNVFIVQNKEGTDWVLIDTGLKSSASKIKNRVQEIFGSSGNSPAAIILTHGHFDHRGSLIRLAEEWEVPVYCHHQERPYLTGQAAYPPADPSVGGGALSLLSFAYPTGPIDAEVYLHQLPEDGRVPQLDDWKWIHTPGHAPGHVSLFREKDGVLIAGDACVTTLQESLLAVATQKEILSGPPKYFTPDWGAAARSVKALAALEPNVIATGHGHALYGVTARKALHKLAKEFWKRGMPASGRYVKDAAEFDENGIPIHIPAASGTMLKKLLAAAAIVALGYVIYKQRKNSSGLSKKIAESLGKKIMGSALGVLGAAAPVAASAPSIPLIPAI